MKRGQVHGTNRVPGQAFVGTFYKFVHFAAKSFKRCQGYIAAAAEYVHGLVEKTIPSTTRMPLHAFVGEIVFRFAARIFRNCYDKNSQRTSTFFFAEI